MKNWFTSHLYSLGVLLLAFLAPIKMLLLTVGVLIFFDFIIGIFKAYKLGEDITSRKMGNTIGKILLYNMAVITIYMLDINLINSGIHPEKIVALLICSTETKSIMESFKILYGIDLWSVTKNLFKRGESTTKNKPK